MWWFHRFVIIGSDDDKDYFHANTIEGELNIKVIRHHKKKPDGLLETIMMWPDIREDEVMMIGDRYLTDIYGGNIYNMLTVRVDIFTEKNDNIGAIFVCFVIIAFICREDVLRSYY